MERSACSLLLIGYQDQDNLGLRYLLSSARQAGFSARIESYSSDPDRVVELVAKLRPHVIGFSLIFQYMSPAFGRVIQALRARGCQAHITIGGHYPSFDYEEEIYRAAKAGARGYLLKDSTRAQIVEALRVCCDRAAEFDASARRWILIGSIDERFRRRRSRTKNATIPTADSAANHSPKVSPCGQYFTTT